MNFYSFHIGDYASHTRNLSLLEDLAYRRILDLYYLSERPLNGSSTDVAREIGMRDQQAEVDYVLGRFFIRDGDLWRNSRADKEIKKYDVKREQASRAGKESVERRLNARSTGVEIKPTGVDESGNGRSTNQEPITNNHKPVKNKEKHIRASRFDAQAHLESAGVPPKVAADWLKTRKQKRLPPTETALEGVKREAEKSGKTLAEVLTICCERGWAGFQAAWLENLENDHRGLPRQRAGPPNVVHFNRQQALEDSNQRVLDEWLKQGGEEIPGGVVIEGEFANEA